MLKFTRVVLRSVAKTIPAHHPDSLHLVESRWHGGHESDAQAREVPTMLAQKGMLCVHRLREGLKEERIACMNHIRGLLAESGVVLPQKPAILRQHLRETRTAPSSVLFPYKKARVSELGGGGMGALRNSRIFPGSRVRSSASVSQSRSGRTYLCSHTTPPRIRSCRRGSG